MKIKTKNKKAAVCYCCCAGEFHTIEKKKDITDNGKGKINMKRKRYWRVKIRLLIINTIYNNKLIIQLFATLSLQGK